MGLNPVGVTIGSRLMQAGFRFFYLQDQPLTTTARDRKQKNPPDESSGFSVGVRRLELPTSTSRTWRAANCATPRLAFATAKVIIDLNISIQKSRFFYNEHQYPPRRAVQKFFQTKKERIIFAGSVKSITFVPEKMTP